MNVGGARWKVQSMRQLLICIHSSFATGRPATRRSLVRLLGQLSFCRAHEVLNSSSLHRCRWTCGGGY